MAPKPHILIVDDEAGIRESLSSILADEGYTAETADSAERAIERAAHGGLDVILLDVCLPGLDGLEALSRIQTLPHPPAVIMSSGNATIYPDVTRHQLSAYEFNDTPQTFTKLITS